MQLELNIYKEYVCNIPSRGLKYFRHILRKDNKPYVTAADIRHFATNLQIYESFHISK